MPVAVLLAVAAGCGSATAPTPTQLTDTFTGTLQPLGTDFKTFTIAYSQASSDLSVTVDSLKTVADFNACHRNHDRNRIRRRLGQHLLASDTDADGGARHRALCSERGLRRDVLRPDLRLPDWNDRLLLDAHGTRHVFDDGEALLTAATTAVLSTNAPGGHRHAQSEHGCADKDASEDPASLLPQSSRASLR